MPGSHPVSSKGFWVSKTRGSIISWFWHDSVRSCFRGFHDGNLFGCCFICSWSKWGRSCSITYTARKSSSDTRLTDDFELLNIRYCCQCLSILCLEWMPQQFLSSWATSCQLRYQRIPQDLIEAAGVLIWRMSARCQRYIKMRAACIEAQNRSESGRVRCADQNQILQSQHHRAISIIPYGCAAFLPGSKCGYPARRFPSWFFSVVFGRFASGSQFWAWQSIEPHSECDDLICFTPFYAWPHILTFPSECDSINLKYHRESECGQILFQSVANFFISYLVCGWPNIFCINCFISF